MGRAWRPLTVSAILVSVSAASVGDEALPPREADRPVTLVGDCPPDAPGGDVAIGRSDGAAPSCVEVSFSAPLTLFNRTGQPLAIDMPEGRVVLEPRSQTVDAPDGRLVVVPRPTGLEQGAGATVGSRFGRGVHEFRAPDGTVHELRVVDDRENVLRAERLSLRGLGPVRVGMSVGEVERLLGVPLSVHDSHPDVPNASDEGDRCGYAYLSHVPDGPAFLVLRPADGGPSSAKIVSVMATENMRTLSGIGVGSTREALLETYGDRLELTPGKYSETYQTAVFVPKYVEDADYRMVFEVEREPGGRVFEMRTGFTEPVQWGNGCY